MKTVRDGRKVWPYCTECGCRLEIDQVAAYYFEGHHTLAHFNGGWGKNSWVDARGHSCSKITNKWIVPFKVVEEYI